MTWDEVGRDKDSRAWDDDITQRVRDQKRKDGLEEGQLRGDVGGGRNLEREGGGGRNLDGSRSRMGGVGGMKVCLRAQGSQVGRGGIGLVCLREQGSQVGGSP